MKQLRYTLGLDIGITSVGWAVLENDSNGEPFRIERLGVRIFAEAEQPKTGASLAAPRRNARGSRRVLRRRRHRKERIKQLIENTGIMTQTQMDELFQKSKYEKNVYELRIDALERKLTAEELVRVLIHLAQKRGYRSNSKSEEAKDAKESGKVKSAISANRQRMQEHGYRTVAEMLWKDASFQEITANDKVIHKIHNSPNDYKVTVERSMIQEEIQMIFEAQKSLGSVWFTDEFCEKYLDIWSGQRSFDEGPGGESPYGGNQILGKVGRCTFEKTELRAAKATYTFEYFRLLQTVNHTRLAGKGLPSRALTEEQRQAYIALTMKSAGATYAQLRKALDMDEQDMFHNLYYGNESKEKQEKKKLNEMQSYHKLRMALNKVEKNAIAQLTMEQLDAIGQILTFYKSDTSRLEQLQQAVIPEKFYPALLELSFSGTGHLSLPAMKKLIPYLEQGNTYDKACEYVYGKQVNQGEKKKKLSIMDTDEIINPVVRRAVSQAIKVINAIVRAYGAPEIVRIELAREVGKAFDERKKIEKRQQQNAAANEHIREQIREYKPDKVTGLDIVKFKLFKEQNGVCLYSGKSLEISRLFEAGYVDIDHIIPYSISFDDSYNNKVLVLAGENRQKGNRLPYGYFGQDAERWNRFETLVSTQIRSFKKRKNLLLRELPKDDKFKQRNLVDTQYLSRVLFRLLDAHLEFAQYDDRKKRTQTVNGVITAEIRRRLGLEKIRADGDLHHAMDAAVIACVSPGMIQKITTYAQNRERFYATGVGYVDAATGEVLKKDEYDIKYSPYFPEPWHLFRKELEARLSKEPQKALCLLKLSSYEEIDSVQPVFVSQMPKHKVTGAAHEETIRSAKKPGYTISKTALTALKLDKKTGEIERYHQPEKDKQLYEALKKRLTEFEGNAKKAFAEPFYKPRADGTASVLVKKVKIYDKSTLNVSVNQGIANNGGMVRVDVFYVDGDGYYFVPIYVPDTKAKELPNRAVKGKSYDEWRIMDESDFVFSLYAGDLLYIQHKNNIKLKRQKDGTGEAEILRREGLFYYKGFNIANGAMSITTHDRKYIQESIGGKTLLRIEKYQVDVLGNYTPVRIPEKRLGFR